MELKSPFKNISYFQHEPIAGPYVQHLSTSFLQYSCINLDLFESLSSVDLKIGIGNFGDWSHLSAEKCSKITSIRAHCRCDYRGSPSTLLIPPTVVSLTVFGSILSLIDMSGVRDTIQHIFLHDAGTTWLQGMIVDGSWPSELRTLTLGLSLYCLNRPNINFPIPDDVSSARGWGLEIQMKIQLVLEDFGELYGEQTLAEEKERIEGLFCGEGVILHVNISQEVDTLYHWTDSI